MKNIFTVRHSFEISLQTLQKHGGRRFSARFEFRSKWRPKRHGCWRWRGRSFGTRVNYCINEILLNYLLKEKSDRNLVIGWDRWSDTGFFFLAYSEKYSIAFKGIHFNKLTDNVATGWYIISDSGSFFVKFDSTKVFY